jgi:hypothetical protein
MKPIVHGLEPQYSGRIDFVYLDTSDSRTTDARRRFQFTGTPQFVLVDRQGNQVGPPMHGVVTEAQLRAALDHLVAESSNP